MLALTRQRDPADERQVRISLTEAGRLLREKGMHMNLVASTGLKPDEFARLLQPLVENAFRHGLADRVENNIVGLTALGEILFDVINDVIGSQRLHQFHIRGTAYSRNLRAIVFGNLYGKSPYAARCAIDAHTLTRLNMPFIA